MDQQNFPAPKPTSSADLAVTRSPRFFKEVIGQPAAISQLLGMYASGVISHIILVGQSGAGKTTVARLFAKLLRVRFGNQG